MKDNDFKNNLKVSPQEISTPSTQVDRESIEALYHYTYNSLDKIFYFLIDFYEKSPTADLHGSKNVKATIGPNYFYSLKFELSHAYDDFLRGNLSIDSFKKQFNDLCSHYKTNPLDIFNTYDSVRIATENPYKHDLGSIVKNIESQVEECYEKMNAEKNSQQQME